MMLIEQQPFLLGPVDSVAQNDFSLISRCRTELILTMSSSSWRILFFHANILPIPNRGSFEHFKFIELSSRMLVALAKKKNRCRVLVGGSKERS
jgi:hypothetical protein